MAGISVAGPAAAGQQQPPQPPPPPGQAAPADPRSPQVLMPRYAFEVEIVEGKCQPHPAGQTIKYPDEKGKICPWLMDAMNGVIRVLEHGGTLPWMYAGTPY